MNGAHGGNLQNVLSISTAANNRYLLHFNSLNSLTQWTAGIRLAMFEHSTLQEAYTGSLVAGKGRFLNNIKQIMERSKYVHEDWARVRFGAGTPWQRCWCVVSPPDEKEYTKAQKTLKKGSAYEKVRIPKGHVKFYDTRKVTKKTQPIATVTDAYAAYAIYPQSKPLIDQSTLVKIEGLVTMHSSMENTTEGFVFAMPEAHAAVSGFEIMLRWLFPVYDAFALYGRPTKLIADSLDQRGLMFAMPRERRYGYLDILDVSGLIVTKGSQSWTERQWRRELKKLTSERMLNQRESAPFAEREPSYRRNTTGVRFGANGPIHSSPGSRSTSPSRYGDNDVQQMPPSRTDSAPPGQMYSPSHKRSVSEAMGYKRFRPEQPSRMSYETGRPNDDGREDYDDSPPEPPRHGGILSATSDQRPNRGPLARIQSESEVPTMNSRTSPMFAPPAPVGTPPVMTHQANSRPRNQLYQAPELRRAQSNVDAATLSQMQEAIHPSEDGEDTNEGGQWSGDVQQRRQNMVASSPAPHGIASLADSSKAMGNRVQRDPRQRLSTIPGSPFVGEDVTPAFASPPPPLPPPPPPPKDSHPQTDTVYTSSGNASDANLNKLDRIDTSTSLHSTRSIARKPLPPALPPVPVPMIANADEPTSPTFPVNTEGMEGGVIDDAALERVLNVDQSRSNTVNPAMVHSGEYYHASPASNSPELAKQLPNRPRAGQLKTVGNADLPSIDTGSRGARALAIPASADVANVDFGSTYSYKPLPRPSTGGNLPPEDSNAAKRRSRSVDDRFRSSLRERLGTYQGGSAGTSPHESKSNSYFGERTGLDNTANTRALPWQPSVQSGALPDNGQSVTQEPWAPRRAMTTQETPQYAVPRTSSPAFAHNRNTSGGSTRPARKLTKTPPAGRALSTELAQNQTGRQSPAGSRSQSRGAIKPPDAMSASLSAREQAMVSRATGTPLLSSQTHEMGSIANHQQGNPVGFVDAREREKASAQSGMPMQRAAFDRQQQQQPRYAADPRYGQQQQQQQYSQYQHQYQHQMPQDPNQHASPEYHEYYEPQQGYGQQQGVQHQNSRGPGQQAGGGGYYNAGPYGPVQTRSQQQQQQPPAMNIPPQQQPPYGAGYYNQHQARR